MSGLQAPNRKFRVTPDVEICALFPRIVCDSGGMEKSGF